MALPTYSTGTVSVAAGGTVVTCLGGVWTGINAKQGDFISIAGLAEVLITEVTDQTHLTIAPWQGPAQSNAAYVIYQNYVGRVVGVAAAEDVGVMLEKLHVDGLPFILGVDETVPDPSYGDEEQLAFKPSTGEWWVKQGGVWVPSAGLTALGYGGTSATSVTIGLSPPAKVFTTQKGLAYNGARVRAASAADLNNWMEGVASYSGTTLTMTADTIGGAGAHADWLFSIAGGKGATGPQGPQGLPGAGASASTANPLQPGTAAPGTATPYAREDHVHPFGTVVRYDAAQALAAAQQAQARVNIGAEQTTRFLATSYGVTAADNNALILCTAANTTMSFAAGSALGDKFKVSVKYTAVAGSLLLTAPAGGTINSRASIRIFPGESVTVWCDGTNLHTVGLTMGLVRLNDMVVSSVASAGWQNIFNDEFTDYRVQLRDVQAIGACTSIVARASQGGAVLATNLYHYGLEYVNSTAEAWAGGSTNLPYFHIIDLALIAGAGMGLSSVIDLPGWGLNTSTLKYAHTHTVQRNAGGIASYLGGGLVAVQGALDGIVFFPNTATFSAGMTLLGVRTQ
jgi:hypothetical protein